MDIKTLLNKSSKVLTIATVVYYGAAYAAAASIAYAMKEHG